MSRMKTGYRRISVCGAVVEEVLHEAGGHAGPSPGDHVASRLYTKNAQLAGGVPPIKNIFSIYFGLLNASTFSIFNRLAGAGQPVNGTASSMSYCRSCINETH
jgi:hypothetical protein